MNTASVVNNKRNTNIELLRVISMIMIITLHYLNQGGILETLTFSDSNYAVVWLIESFCYVSVNCYVFISGFFLCESTFKLRKVFDIVCEVVFYSVGIYLFFCIIGVESFSLVSLITGYLFPIIHGEYWFATVYVVLYLISPYINKGLNTLDKKEHQKLIAIMGLVFSVIPSVFFFSGNNLGVDGGYSLIWFVFLYIVSAYLRKYSVKIKNIYLMLTFVLSSLVTFLVKYCQVAFLGTEHWDLYRYSSITVLLASVSLFMLFVQMEPRNQRVWSFFGSTTFGVFLIHTQYIMRDKILWKEIIKPLQYCYENTGVFLLHMIISVLLVYVLSSIVDYLRIVLFDLIKYFVSAKQRKAKG